MKKGGISEKMLPTTRHSIPLQQHTPRHTDRCTTPSPAGFVANVLMPAALDGKIPLNAVFKPQLRLPAPPVQANRAYDPLSEEMALAPKLRRGSEGTIWSGGHGEQRRSVVTKITLTRRSSARATQAVCAAAEAARENVYTSYT